MGSDFGFREHGRGGEIERIVFLSAIVSPTERVGDFCNPGQLVSKEDVPTLFKICNFLTFRCVAQHSAGKARSLSNERWLKRALGAAQKRDRSKFT